MKLVRKPCSVRGKKFSLSKPLLLMSLTAIGLLGGFFVLNVVATTSVLRVEVPNDPGTVWGGIREIKWTTGSCETDDTVDIGLVSNGGETKDEIASGVSCSDGSYFWNTRELTTDGTPIEERSDYKILVYKTHIIQDESDNAFTIDNTAPGIDNATLLSPNGGENWAGEDTYDITWDSDKITDLHLGSKPISLSYSVDGGDHWIIITSGLEKDSEAYSWEIPAGIDEENVKVKITATDLAGNSASDESDEAFRIDSTKPTATIIADTATVSEKTSTKTIRVVYNEPMNRATMPAIIFSIGSWTKGEGEWSEEEDNVWVQNFTVSSEDEEAAVNVKVSGAKDLAGNMQEEGNLPNAFLIDTQNPTVVSATATPNPAKAGTVNILIEFSEDMDTEISPAVEILEPEGSPIAVNEGFYSGKIWTGSFILAGNNKEGITAIISVKGAEDANGNEMADDSDAGMFVIDTVSPVANSISLGASAISDDNLVQEVTIIYNEPMSAAPAISFNAGNWAKENNGSWSSDNKTWIQSFKTTDAGQEIAAATVTASGAKDLAGNAQASSITSSAFAIDTKNPTVVLSNYADNIVKNNSKRKIIATFTETNGIDETNVPKITIGSLVAGATMSKKDSNNLIWEYDWTVSSTGDGEVNVSISARDIFGNTNDPASGEISYIIDNTKPTVSLSYAPNRAVRDADNLVITATFVEANGIDESNSDAPQITIGSIVTGAKMTKTNNLVWTYDFDVPSGNDGSVAVIITGKDKAGNRNDATSNNTFVIDNTAPTFFASNGTETGPVKTDTINVKVNEANGIVSSKYGFSENETCDAADAYTADFISETEFAIAGNHTDYLCATAQDAAGNIGYGLIGRLNTDNIAPQVTVDFLTTKSSTPQLSGKVNDSGANIKVTVNNKIYDAIISLSGSDIIWTAAVTDALPDGTYDVKAIAADAAGNTGTDSTTGELEIDATAPVVSDNIPSEWQTAPFTVTFTCNDSTGAGCEKVYYTTDSSNPDPLSASFADSENHWSFTVSTDGAYAIKYISEDLLGNLSNVKTIANALKIDQAAPSTDDNASDGIMNDEVTVILTSTDETSGVASTKYCIDKTGSCIPTLTGTSVPVSAEGTNYVRYYSIDKAGNSETVKSASVVIDKTDPVISIVSPAAGDKVNGDATIVFTDTELNSPQCSINNVNWVSCASVTTKLSDIAGFEALTDSNFLLYIKDTDDAGNTGSTSIAGIIKDTSAPEIDSVFSDKQDGTYKAGAVIDIDVAFSENVAGNILITLNTGRTCGFTIDDSKEGSCEYKVQAGDNTADLDAIISGSLADEAGNAMENFIPTISLAAAKGIVIDTNAPIIGPHEDITVEATSAAGATVIYIAPTASEEAVVTCTSASGTTFPLGNTTVKCNAVDAAGNAAAETSFKITVRDTIAPSIADNEDIVIEATLPAGATVDYEKPAATDAVDPELNVVCLPKSGSTFALGTTPVSCTATDASGNSSTSSFNVTVRDTIAPKIKGLTPADKSVTSAGSPTIGAQFEESGSGIDESSIIFSLDEYADADYFAEKSAFGASYTPVVPLANGTYHAAITVSDKAGNSATTSWIFIINKAVSNISISSDKTSVPADGTSSTSITAIVLNNGIPVPNAAVNFATTIGDLFEITNTNFKGQATAVLKSSIAGTTTVTATYNSGDGIVQGNYSLDFTPVMTDATAPTATSNPVDGATEVSAKIKPIIAFSEKMEESTLENIELRKYGTDIAIPAALAISTVGGKTSVTINPNSALDSGSKYYFYLSGAKDLAGNAIVSWTQAQQADHEFTTAADVTAFEISLGTGWNLISLPIIPNDKNIEHILSALPQESVDIVQYYDAGEESWSSYKPGIGGTLSTMEDGKGYWIYMNTPQVLAITGKEWPQGSTVPLSYTVLGKKWNLIGLKSATQKSAGEYMSQMGDDDVIWAYRNGKYESLTKTGLMEPGFGYWFYTFKPEGFDIIPK